VSRQPAGEARAAPGDRREAEAAERDQREAEAAERDRHRAEAAERDQREADEDAREARAVLDGAEREVTSANDRHQALLRRIEDLERQLGQLQAESAQDLRVLRQAQRSRDVAARALDGALRRLARAQAKVSAIRGGGAP
jgi:chromosome segregation ATPase